MSAPSRHERRRARTARPMRRRSPWSVGVFTTAVTDVFSFALAAVCFVLLTAVRMPPWAVVLIGAGGGVLLALV